MKRALFLALTIALGFGISASALAATAPQCVQLDTPQAECSQQLGDISVDKQVMVEDGTFVEADSVGTAPTAYIGQAVTWRITVSNTQETPFGSQGNQLIVEDVIPAQFSVQNVVASAGDYIVSTGKWSIPLPLIGHHSETLTITTKAENAGNAIENIATLTSIAPIDSADVVSFADDNSANDSNSAFIVVSTKPDKPPVVTDTTPKVLGATTTLANTGENTLTKVFFALMIVAVASTVGIVGRRRYVLYRYRG
jgi:uncharacterized repeat protein (TIGR01451 family)